MASIVFCDHCRATKGWRKPSLRTTTDACDICGGHDVIRKRRVNRRTGKEDIQVVNLKNFEHDERFLVGTPGETRLQEPLS